MTRVSRLLVALAIPFAAVTPALGQSVLQVFVTAGSIASNVGPGGSLPLTASGVGQPVLANVTVRYGGTATATITGISVTGTSEITLSLAPTFPITLNPNGSTSFAVQYSSATGTAVTAQVAIAFTENNQASTFPFFLTGSAPNLTFSYLFTSTGTVTPLNSGDRINFPATNVGASAAAVVNVLNSGTAVGLLQSVTLTGTGFLLTGSAGTTQLQPGQQVSFNVVFTPQTTGASQGLLTLALNNRSVSFTLTGTATSPAFNVTYTLADGIAHSLPDSPSITFPAIDINGTTTATIDISNQGTGAGTVTSIQISGAGFQLSGVPLLPATVAAGQGLRFGIVFAPSKSGSFAGTFLIALSGRSIAGTLTAATAPSNISLAYVDPDTNNILPLPDGSTLTFPNTLSGAVTSITLLAINSGAGTGVINSVTLGGRSPAAFQLLNLPVLPLSVPPAQQLRFGIRFNPQQQQAASATLAVNLNSQTLTINVVAQATGPQFTYSYGTGATGLPPGGTLAIADTAVGQTSSVTISVKNAGTGDGQITAIAVTGQGLSLTDVPTVPLTLHPNGSQQFTLNFTPTQPGAASGRLTIGTDTFTVTGSGIGSRLIYTYTNAASAIPVNDGGVVIFPPIQVGNSETVDFSVQNTGTSATTISSINFAATSTAFALNQLPGMPLNLDPGATVTFSLGFVPNNTGNLTATLRINTSSFTLSGTGTPPAALPLYQFQGIPSNPQPAQQPAIGLTLASPYPLALQGTLKLTFVSTVFTDDPAVQFASGGRTVNFTMPANSTRALFNGNPTVALQTGTTAGNIVVTPSFATQGGFDMTPATPDTLTLAIPRSAPQLVNASVTSQTLSSFTVILNGYSTTRGVRQLDIQIAPKQGETFSSTHLTLDVSSASTAWFQGATSQGFGGTFSVAIPFVLQNGSATDDLVHRLQSLSITATNEIGASNAVSVSIP